HPHGDTSRVSPPAPPRTVPEGPAGRVRPGAIGLGSVWETCHWKIPPAGTRVSSTFMPIVPAGRGGGVGVGDGEGTGVGVGMGVGVGPPAETPPPPQPHEPTTAIAKRTTHSLPPRADF